MNAQILGCSFDCVEDNRAFAEKFNYNFPLLCDERREIGMAYGACETPDVEYAKRISYVISPEGKIEHVYGHVDPPKHPAEVLADVKGGQAAPTHESSG